MTVATDTARVSYSGAGSTGPFTIPFYFLENAHIRAVLLSAAGTETVLTLTTDYTLTGAGVTAGGTLTTVAAVAVGATLTIIRDVSQTQETQWPIADPFPARSHERSVDKLTMIVQQLSEELSRAQKLPESETGTAAKTTLPLSTVRASKFLAFDASGNPTAADGSDGTTGALAVALAASGGSALVGHIQSGTGSVSEDVQTALRRFVHTAQYSTQGNYETARDALTGTFGVNDLDVSGRLLVTGEGPHVIGNTSTDDRYGLAIDLVHTQGSGASTALLRLTGNLTPLADKPAYVMTVHGATINSAASGTHSNFTGFDVSPPTIVNNGATVSLAATVYISGTPTGASENVALFCGGPLKMNGVIYGNNSSVNRIDLNSSSDGAIHFRSIANMKFRIDADANETGKEFIWEHNSGTELMKLTDSAVLTVPTVGSGLTSALSLTTSGGKQVEVAHVASAVNYIQLSGEATASRPRVAARGTDTNVGMVLSTQGSGAFSFMADGASFRRQFEVTFASNSVNYLQVAGAATGAVPTLSAQGSDTNVDLALTPKGTGRVRFGTHAALGAETVSGYITIKDSGGTERKVAVVS